MLGQANLFGIRMRPESLCVYCKTKQSDIHWDTPCKVFHDWSNDCERCANCGQTRRNEHRWRSGGCKCSECGKFRDEWHDWTWDCEKCATCKRTRDGCHDWSEDCEKCTNCRKTRSNGHEWSGCKCLKCGKTRNQEHDWNADKGESCTVCGISRMHSERLRRISELPQSKQVFANKICELNLSDDPSKTVPQHNMMYIVEFMSLLGNHRVWNWSGYSAVYNYPSTNGLIRQIRIHRHCIDLFTIVEENEYRDGIEVYSKFNYL